MIQYSICVCGTKLTPEAESCPVCYDLARQKVVQERAKDRKAIKDAFQKEFINQLFY
jgi:hypothetical protein